ncbi:hypothetical protein C8R44DRAFT_809743 [Mycena epipterygia]|nr:hypothetical protein C8R44DRAFT_809743 [Mycena epipterygia]
MTQSYAQAVYECVIWYRVSLKFFCILPGYICASFGYPNEMAICVGFVFANLRAGIFSLFSSGA